MYGWRVVCMGGLCLADVYLAWRGHVCLPWRVPRWLLSGTRLSMRPCMAAVSFVERRVASRLAAQTSVTECRLSRAPEGVLVARCWRSRC